MRRNLITQEILSVYHQLRPVARVALLEQARLILAQSTATSAPPKDRLVYAPARMLMLSGFINLLGSFMIYDMHGFFANSDFLLQIMAGMWSLYIFTLIVLSLRMLWVKPPRMMGA